MDAPTRGATRLARAASFGVATLALAAGSHVAAGGGLPSMTILAILAIPVTMAAMALTGRRCGPVLLLASMAGAQVLLHETLEALTAQVPADPADHLSAARFRDGRARHGPGRRLVGHDDGGARGGHRRGGLAACAGRAGLVAAGLQTPAGAPSDPAVVGSRPHRSAAPVSVPALVPSVVSGGQGLRGPPARLVATA